MSERNLIIAGSAGPLARRLARIAANGGAQVAFATEGVACPEDAEVWYFAGPRAVDADAFRGARAFHYVVTPYGGTGGWEWLCAPGVPAAAPPFCTRVFRTSLTIDAAGAGREGFLHVLAAIFDLKTEIDERVTDYFEHRALRLHAPADARVNLIRAQDAAAMMLDIAAREGAGESVIASRESDALGDVLERAGSALGISLLAEEDPGRLTAIDELFALRLNGFARALETPPGDADAIGEEEQMALFGAAAAALHEERRAFLGRARSFPASLRRVDAGDGFAYYTAGSGPRTIVIVNAFGQVIDFWFRLIEQLRPRFRILIAERRDLASLAGAGIPDLVGDVEAMTEREDVRDFHLVAWCTGPRVGVEYALRHPERVRSIVFLNPTLRCAGGPPEFGSAFERNFDVLMQMLEQRPAMASSMMSSLRASAGADDGIGELLADPDADVATMILSRINTSLREAVAAPFATAESFTQFTRGIDRFWSYDIREKASAIGVPVLFLSAEHDRVAMPAGSEAAVGLFPRGRHVHVPGATHYFLYDRPDVTAAVIEAFLADPDAVGTGV